MSQPPTWNDVQREEAGVQVVLPLSAARRLRILLPRLLRVLDDRAARSPEDRERRRDTHAAFGALASALEDGLRPLDPLERPARDG